MFKNTFQSGFLSILYSIGSKPLQIWDKKGKRCPLLHACEGACAARRGVGARGAGPGGGMLRREPAATEGPSGAATSAPLAGGFHEHTG